MSRKEIYDRLTDVFRLVMDNDSIILQDNTCSDDIEEWDSLAHVQLIDAIQKEFHVKVTAKEMVSWPNVGAMVSTLEEKLQ